MKKALLIYNPNAGKKRINVKLGEVVREFDAADYEVTLHPTRCRGDAAETARREAEHYDLIACCGGDGTLNEVVSGLVGVGDAPGVGYLPAGTANDFSRTLKLPSDLVKSARIAACGTPAPCDVGWFNGRNFIYVAAFGVFTDASYAATQNIKNILGYLAYILYGVRSLASLKTYHAKISWDDQEPVEGDFIYFMVTDSVSVGGFRGITAKELELDDGKFEVMLVKKPKSLEDLGSIASSLLKQEPNGNVIGAQASRVTVECDVPVPWTLDGEFGGEVQNAEIRNLHRAVRIVRGE